MQQLLGKMHVHLNETELDIVLDRVGSDDKGNVGFVEFHKALFKAEHSATMTSGDFSRGIVLLGMPIEKKQIQKMYKSLVQAGDGRVFFEQVRQELHDMRDPILKAILSKFDAKLQVKLKLWDCEGLFSVVALREGDVKILVNMKPEQALDVLRRLEQTLRRDRSKSGRMTLSRLLGTCKSKDEHDNSPVKVFLGDYVATVFQLSGVRPAELFQKIDHSGDGFLSLDELSNGFRRVNEEAPDTMVEMTTAEMSILHAMLDADGDGDLSFKELRYWLDHSQDYRAITYRAFHVALQELGFGELRESMMKNIYVACVNDDPKSRIYFDQMYHVLHTTDENGVSLFYLNLFFNFFFPSKNSCCLTFSFFSFPLFPPPLQQQQQQQQQITGSYRSKNFPGRWTWQR
jgi:Ca2+-binding EF-hand superfamily protein